jgi:hypothetical protein
LFIIPSILGFGLLASIATQIPLQVGIILPSLLAGAVVSHALFFKGPTSRRTTKPTSTSETT